jgi:uncharacterized membrane protein
MTNGGHLWAIGYNDMERAEQVRAQVAGLAESRCLILIDTAVVVCYPDGSVTLNGEPFVSAPQLRGHSFVSFLAGLALGAPPLTGGAAGAFARACGGTAAEVGIDDKFIAEVQAGLKPGTSALFVLDQAGDMAAILQGIRGLGGTVLKTNVDLDRANLIQSTLASEEPDCR